MKKLLVILGPTSTGKTDLALKVAQKFDGEIISADSRQVYKGLDIGTGKMPSEDTKVKKGKGFWEISGAKIWLYDVIDSNKQFTVADYIKETSIVIKQIIKRGRLPIVVGGTGLYIKALTEGLSNLSIPFDKKLRESLEELSLADLQNKLKEISKKRWKKMNYSDQQNSRRLTRAIEIELGSSNTQNKVIVGLKNEFRILKIGLTTSREILYKRSDQRVISRTNQGIIKEAEKLNKEGFSLKRMRQLGLEYAILADFLEGKIKTKDEFIKILQYKIHGYIRRQLTWFKKEKNVYWFDISKEDFLSQVEKKVSQWYY